jgi:hypothetical protein
MNFVEFWSIFGRFLALFGPFDVKTEPCASALVFELFPFTTKGRWPHRRRKS